MFISTDDIQFKMVSFWGQKKIVLKYNSDCTVVIVILIGVKLSDNVDKIAQILPEHPASPLFGVVTLRGVCAYFDCPNDESGQKGRKQSPPAEK